MRKFILAGMVAAATLMSAPAAAGVVMNANGSVTTSGASGGMWTVNLDGYGGASPAVIAGLTSSITFTFLSGGGTNNYTFGYTVNNTSGSPITGSRVSGFGFEVDPNAAILTSSAAGFFDRVDSGNYPVSYGNVEFCVANGGNSCAGGGGTGVAQGASGSGSFNINFAANQSQITLGRFVDRYQSIEGANTASAIGRPTVTDPVPEPSTWAMMLIGFGAVGFGMRRRQSPKLLQLA